MVNEQELATTAISVTYELEPTRNIVGDLSGLIGTFCDSLVGAFYERSVSRKANVVVTELFNNAVAYNCDDGSKIRVRLSVDGDSMSVRVRNRASGEQCAQVKARIAAMRAATDPRQLLADTIRERRRHQLPGGLGLLRLVAENKFSLAARDRAGTLEVEARIRLGGAA